jgi:hypothetical protein
MRAFLLILPFLFASALFPQATTNEVYTYSALQGDAVYVYGTVRIDSPLTLMRDSGGTPHLGSAITTVTPVRNEIPAVSTGPNQTVWTLAFTPAYGSACYRNGLRQNPAADYTLAASTITSTAWAPTDVILCDYEYVN